MKARHPSPETVYTALVAGEDGSIPWPTRALLLTRWRSSQGSGMAQDVIECLPRDDRVNVEPLFQALVRAVNENPQVVQGLLVAWDRQLRAGERKGFFRRLFGRKKGVRKP